MLLAHVPSNLPTSIIMIFAPQNIFPFFSLSSSIHSERIGIIFQKNYLLVDQFLFDLSVSCI